MIHLAPTPLATSTAAFAGVTLIIILGLFLAAAVIGPLLHANGCDDESEDDPHSPP